MGVLATTIDMRTAPAWRFNVHWYHGGGGGAG